MFTLQIVNVKGEGGGGLEEKRQIYYTILQGVGSINN